MFHRKREEKVYFVWETRCTKFSNGSIPHVRMYIHGGCRLWWLIDVFLLSTYISFHINPAYSAFDVTRSFACRYFNIFEWFKVRNVAENTAALRMQRSCTTRGTTRRKSKKKKKKKKRKKGKEREREKRKKREKRCYRLTSFPREIHLLSETRTSPRRFFDIFPPAAFVCYIAQLAGLEISLAFTPGSSLALPFFIGKRVQ